MGPIRKYLFVDEAGNFDFRNHPGASQYYVLTSVTFGDARSADQLLELRRELVWAGHPINGPLHATSDKQVVRDHVFAALQGLDIRIDATIALKRKIVPHRQSQLGLYKLMWYEHAKYVIPRSCAANEELLVVAASLGTKKGQKTIGAEIIDVINQVRGKGDGTQVAHWSADSDPCLWVTDYCCWAIQRKWEGNDTRSYELIEDKITTEFEFTRYGTVLYY